MFGDRRLADHGKKGDNVETPAGEVLTAAGEPWKVC
jgi:hypothetical protein